MKPLLRIVLILALIFASSFILMNILGIFDPKAIFEFFNELKNTNPIFLFFLIIFLFSIDIVLAIPTLTICILAGHFLGTTYGGFAASLGIMTAGGLGYLMSRILGDKLLGKILPDKIKQEQAKNAFEKYGLTMILLSRCSPLLPEITSCIAGSTKMNFIKFYSTWALVSVPYAFVASYSGSISTIDNPYPAIFTSIGIYVLFGIAWLIFKKSKKISLTNNKQLKLI